MLGGGGGEYGALWGRQLRNIQQVNVLSASLLGISPVSPTETQARVCNEHSAALLIENTHRYRMVKNDTLVCSHFILVKSK